MHISITFDLHRHTDLHTFIYILIGMILNAFSMRLVRRGMHSSGKPIGMLRMPLSLKIICYDIQTCSVFILSSSCILISSLFFSLLRHKISKNSENWPLLLTTHHHVMDSFIKISEFLFFSIIKFNVENFNFIRIAYSLFSKTC